MNKRKETIFTKERTFFDEECRSNRVLCKWESLMKYSILDSAVIFWRLWKIIKVGSHYFCWNSIPSLARYWTQKGLWVYYFENVISINKMLFFIHTRVDLLWFAVENVTFFSNVVVINKKRGREKTGQNIVIKNSSKNSFNIRWKAFQMRLTGGFFQSLSLPLTFVSCNFVHRYLDVNQRRRFYVHGFWIKKIFWELTEEFVQKTTFLQSDLLQKQKKTLTLG